MFRFLKYFYVINLIALIILFFYKDKLPTSLSFLLATEPQQTATTVKPFYVQTPEMRFYIEPVYNYKIYGLVVSKYDARKGYTARVDKNLNVTDLCVIWGDSALNLYFKTMEFWSGTFTCFYRDKNNNYKNLNNDVPGYFKNHELSNNHILTNDPKFAKKLRNINIGDQIHIEGYLANYGASPSHIFRYTSTVRTDTGNGACETLYVKKFDLIRMNPYRKIYYFSLLLFVVMTIGGIWQQMNYSRREREELATYMDYKEVDENNDEKA